MASALLLINLHSRQGKQNFHCIQSYLEELGIQLLTKSSEHPQQIPQLIHHHHKEVDFVIIGGGDGTFNSAIAPLLETQLPLGIIPLGTANDDDH